MKALNCEKLTHEEFNKLLTESISRPIYTVNPNESISPVAFHFNFSAAWLNDAIFIIDSDKAGGYVYRGPYQDKIVIQAGEYLLSNKGRNDTSYLLSGGDTLSFIFLNKKTNETCAGVHESEPFWQANKNVYIDLLPFRELNKIGLPVSFKVRIE
jgi:hypothetical protein